MNNEMTLDESYNVLEIDDHMTNWIEIKKKYKQMLLKYHPDKNNNVDSHEKFIKIHTAYNVLLKHKMENDENKNENEENENEENDSDDITNYLVNNDMYGMLKYYMKNNHPQIDLFYKNVIKMFRINEHELKNDVNTFNIDNIAKKISIKNILNDSQ